MAWIITKDYIAEGDEPTRVGEGQWAENVHASGEVSFENATRGGKRVTFHLEDEDGERHYDGIFVDMGEEEDCWGAEDQAWQWGMWMSGATEYKTLTHAWDDRDKTGPKAWYSVFG